MKTVDISGMGGAYELCCQVMLSDALERFRDWSYEDLHNKLVEEEKKRKKYVDYWVSRNFEPWKEYCNNYPYGELYLEFWELWKRYEPSGAMAEAVQNYLLIIKKLGHDGWIRTAEEKDPERIYEIDVDKARKEVEEYLVWCKAHPEEAMKQAFEEGKKAARSL